LVSRIHIRTDEKNNRRERTDLLKALADALLDEYKVSRSVEMIEEAIAVYEGIAHSRSSDHQQRAEVVHDLGVALGSFCLHHGEDWPWTRGRRCIELLRESLELRPPGHPWRDEALHHLASFIRLVKYKDASERRHQLAESISLGRDALELRPVGHPERYKSLISLALSLGQFYQFGADQQALEEMIAVQRQVVQMSPPGHELRPNVLGNLAIGLELSFEQCGSIERLTEGISLYRECLLLHPIGHHQRYRTLDNLARALCLSAQLHGASELFFESISLHREALELVPADDPERWRIMGNLSEGLMHTYLYGCGSSGAISEAVNLHRESLHERQLLDSPLLDNNMSDLAECLAVRFDMYQTREDLLEAISLQRQALHLRSIGHRQRPQSLNRLANLLCRPECRSWAEALALFREGLKLCPSGFSNRAPLLSDMSRCFLEPSSSFFDLKEGIVVVSEAHSDQFCHVNIRLKYAVSNLRRVEQAYNASTGGLRSIDDDDISNRILDLYIEVIGLLPRVAHFGLDHSTRLQAVIGSDEIARNAAARAVLLGRIPQAVEMLEEGRGVFWSQTLHLRAAGFDGVPDRDRQELERLLQLLYISTRRAQGLEISVTQREQDLESRRKLNEEAEALITMIRGYPGLARFLMPAAFADLVRALPSGYVVILNSSALGQHALLLNSATGLATSLELQASHREFDSDTIRSQVDRNALREESNESAWDDTRAMKLSVGRLRSLDDTLALLWNSIVRPVVEKLHIEVCATGTTVS
jgi:tetratricopeptide (TPR) repeat protein